MLLYLVRHGIAVDPTDPKSPPDPERPLTPRGIQKTRSAALVLRALGTKPDVILSSPYVRALQTAEIFAEALGYAPEKIRQSESLRPSEDPAEIMREIARLRVGEVACFGHAPHLDMTVAQLAGARGPVTQLKKAGTACFEQAAAHGRWELLWILTPKVLRDLGD